MKEIYRFWSLDSLYLEICKAVIEDSGVSIRDLLKDSVEKDGYLLHGTVYIWGKAEGRPYPPGSNPKHPPIRGSYPATLEIRTESADRLGHLERELEIEDDIPRDSRRKLAPSEEWDAREIPEKKSNSAKK